MNSTDNMGCEKSYTEIYSELVMLKYENKRLVNTIVGLTRILEELLPEYQEGDE